MKRSIIFLAVIMASFVLAFAGGRKKNDDVVVVKYDRFKDLTMVMVSTRHGVREVGAVTDREFRFAYGCPGNNARCKPSEIVVACVFNTLLQSGWQLMDGPQEVIFLADQGRIALNDVKWDGNTNSGSVYTMIENLTGTISLEQLHKLTAANVVEVKVGRFQFKIPKDEVEKWQKLDTKILGLGATTN